jgi:hypothetical protein
VVPLRDLEIRWRVKGAVRSVAAISGQPVHYQAGHDCLMVRVPKLEEYEVLLFDFEA